jgi:2-polyprenyl-3-methyl-5-hydroxy-6-metoxy-1,4-benzoquinol methylase
MTDTQFLERTISGLHNDLVQSLPKLSYDTSVLDIGCGTGAWLERLANLGFSKLYGIDLDTSQFKSNKAACFQANLDFDDLNLKDKKFGLITAIEVIEHLKNPGRLFYHVSKLLEEDGFFLLTTPNIYSISCRLKFLITEKLSSFDEKGDPTHIYPVLLTSLQRVLPRYSLKVTRKWGYPERGSLVSRPSTSIISAFLERIIPNGNSGDSLCLLIQKSK